MRRACNQSLECKVGQSFIDTGLLLVLSSKPGFTNLNQPRAAHLSAGSYGGPHGVILG